MDFFFFFGLLICDFLLELIEDKRRIYELLNEGYWGNWKVIWKKIYLGHYLTLYSKKIPDRGKGMCKGPEAAGHLTRWRTTKKLGLLEQRRGDRDGKR